MNGQRARDSSRSPAIERTVRRLSALAELADAEVALLRQMTQGETHGFGSDMQPQGGPPVSPRTLVQGFACRYRMLADGRRQIYDFLIAGDLIGFHAEGQPLGLTSIAALTQVETVLATPLRDAARLPEHPGLSLALRRSAELEQQRLLDHVVRLGRQTAHERMAHLLLELNDRLAVVGLGDGRRFQMPLTQETLSDALGLSVVHVNRILQQLRRERLIELRAGECRLLEPDLLAQIADYAPPPFQLS